MLWIKNAWKIIVDNSKHIKLYAPFIKKYVFNVFNFLLYAIVDIFMIFNLLFMNFLDF